MRVTNAGTNVKAHSTSDNVETHGTANDCAITYGEADQRANQDERSKCKPKRKSKRWLDASGFCFHRVGTRCRRLHGNPQPRRRD